ncbi:uncharacterized protein LAESUDRAFT_647585, partial [Laetiporus sulphureus 93-53]
AAIIFYEYILTLSDEVSLVWSGHLTITNVLFVANRYFLLSLGFANVMESLYWSSSQVRFQAILICISLTLPRGDLFWCLYIIFRMVVTILPKGISALRVYAIGGHLMILPTFVLAFGLVPAICNIVSSHLMPLVILIFVSRLCPLASDMIVLVVTWVNTYKIARQARAVKGTASLAVFLLRDGVFDVLILPQYD